MQQVQAFDPLLGGTGCGEANGNGGASRSSIATTDHSPAADHRRDFAAPRLAAAWRSKKRICVLECGAWREADGLLGQELGDIVAVDLDLAALERVWRRHGNGVELFEDHALNFLASTAKSGRQFDFIYTLGLTDAFDEQEMLVLHRLMKSCLAPGGELMVTCPARGNQAAGIVDSALDRSPAGRTEGDMRRYARSIGLEARTSRDPTGTILFSEMGTPGD